MRRSPRLRASKHARQAYISIQGRTSHGGNAEDDEEETRAVHRPAQHLAAHHHDPAGVGIGLHVHAAAREDQPGPRHPGRPVGGAHGEVDGRCRRDQRRHGEVARHHREPRQRAGRLGGRGHGLRRSGRAHAAVGRDAASQGGGRHLHAHRHRRGHHEGGHRQALRDVHRLRREHHAQC